MIKFLFFILFVVASYFHDVFIFAVLNYRGVLKNRGLFGCPRDYRNWSKLFKFNFIYFCRLSVSTFMRLRKVSVLLRPVLENLEPRLKPHIRLSNAALLLHKAVALI